jgi:hypothetical protein
LTRLCWINHWFHHLFLLFIRWGEGLYWKHSVDWCGRHEDSCGSTGQGRPRRSAATRRLPGTPAESEVPGAPINRPVLSLYTNNIITN